MKRMSLVVGCLALIIGLWCDQPNAAAVPVYSAVGLNANVYLHDPGLGVSDEQGESQNDSTNSLAAVVSASRVYADASATAWGNVEATWAGADAGAVHLQAGMDLEEADYPLEQFAYMVRGAALPAHWYGGYPFWVYTFVPDANGVFQLSYTTSFTYILVFNDQVGFIGQDDHAGSRSFSFSKGEICTVRLFMQGMNGGGSAPYVHERQDFNCSWSIQSAVPVAPATWGSVKALYSE